MRTNSSIVATIHQWLVAKTQQTTVNGVVKEAARSTGALLAIVIYGRTDWLWPWLIAHRALAHNRIDRVSIEM